MLAALVAGVGTALIVLMAVNPKPPPDPSFLVQLARLDRARDLLYIHWPLYSLVTCITITALGESIAHRQERKGIPRTNVGRFVSIMLLDLLIPAGCMLGLLINRDYVAARVITAVVGAAISGLVWRVCVEALRPQEESQLRGTL